MKKRNYQKIIWMFVLSLILAMLVFLKIGMVIKLDEFNDTYDFFVKKEISLNFVFYDLVGMQDIDQMSEEHYQLLLEYCSYQNHNDINCKNL